jgi:hypothetical protein
LYKIWNTVLSCLSIFLFTLFFGCASLAPFPPGKPFSQQDTVRLISNLQDQEGKTLSFQGIGKLNLKKGEEAMEANFLAVGTHPSKIRLEITHPWGRPLLHMVADKTDVSILSLTDKKFFKGPLNASGIKHFFLDGIDLDLALTIFSASIPMLPAPGGAVSLNPLEISLYNKEGELVEKINFYSGTLLPKSIYLPNKGLTIIFSEFKQGDVGPHPLKIEVLSENKDQLVMIQYKSLTFNKPVPKEIFQLNPPPNFEIINLNNSSWLGRYQLSDYINDNLYCLDSTPTR